MAILPDNSIASYAARNGFTGNGLTMAIAIALAESGGNTAARGVNRSRSGATLSVDRGLWQINNVYHKEVDDACAFDANCSAGAAYRISNRGTDWRPWSTYGNGAYRAYMQRALSAASTVGRSSTSTPPSPTASAPMPPGGVLLSYEPISTPIAEVTTASYGNKSDVMKPYRWILAWSILFAMLYAISRTRAGYVAIYYAEALILFFLFATQFQFFRESLLPILSRSPQGRLTPPEQHPPIQEQPTQPTPPEKHPGIGERRQGTSGGVNQNPR